MNRNFFVCLFVRFVSCRRCDTACASMFRIAFSIYPHVFCPKPNRFIIYEYVTSERLPDTGHIVFGENPKPTDNNTAEKKKDVKPKAPHVHFASIFMFISSSGCHSWCFLAVLCLIHFYFIFRSSCDFVNL